MRLLRCYSRFLHSHPRFLPRHSRFYSVIPGFYPVIPAKAGIQRVGSGVYALDIPPRFPYRGRFAPWERGRPARRAALARGAPSS